MSFHVRAARRAGALPMVLMSLGLVGALAVGGAFQTRRAVADARTDNRSLALRSEAERAIVLAFAGLDSSSLAQQPGATFAGSRFVTPQTVTSAWITVLSEGLIWVASEAATTSKPLLYNRLAVLCQWEPGAAPGCFGATWFELP